MYSIVLGVMFGGAVVGQPAVGGCQGRTAFYPAAPRDPVVFWNEATLDAIRAGRTPPPKAARNLAMVHIAIQDAVNSITRIYQSYLVSLQAEAGTAPEAAVAVAAHCVLIHLYPDQVERFDRLLDEALAAVPEGVGRDAGVRLGHAVAEKVLAWRARDGADRSVLYRPREGADFWLPTPPQFRSPLLPQWGHVTPFAMRAAADFRAPPPPTCATQEFARSLEEVKLVGAVNSQTRTREQTEIARFWAGGEGTATPPGLWNRVAQAAAEARGLSLVERARLFALLNIALADAAIACWDGKYHFDYVRPVTAIRRADHDGNPDTWSDPSWTPLLPTPPFPSYTSGHSTFSAAGAAVLAEVLGDEVRFSVGSDDLPGVQRSFARFSDAAAEAGRSRIYGGIHYDFDDREGQKAGAALGRYVARNLLTRR